MAQEQGEGGGPERGGLERGLRLVHVYAITTGAMFSSGFFLLPGLAAGETGPSVFLAYLMAGLLVVPALLSTAELSAAMPHAGGPYHFLRRSLGPPVALVAALGLWIAMVLKAAFALVGIGAYLGLLIDLPVAPVAAVTAAGFTALNVFATRESARVQIGLVAVLLAVLAAWVAAGVADVSGRSASELTDSFSPLLTAGPTGLLGATAMVFVSYAGILQIASVAGEVVRPGRTIPRGLLLSLGTATFVYVVGTMLMVATLEPGEFRDDETPVATAVEGFPLPGGTVLVVAAALAAFASTGNAGIMSASRYPLALARERLLWGRFARLGRFGTPTASVVLTGAATLGLILALDVEGIAKLASAFLLMVFGLLNVAVLVLRRARVRDYAPVFRSPLHPWTQLVGIGVSVTLIVDLGWMPAAFLAGVTAIGVAWYLAFGRRRTEGHSTVLTMLHRLGGRVQGADMERLQEEGPRGEDRAAEVLAKAVVTRAAAGVGLDEVVADAAQRLAEGLGVAPERVLGWIAEPHLVSVVLPERGVAVHEVLLDVASEPQVVLAWSPAAPGGGDGADGRRASGRGAVGALITAGAVRHLLVSDASRRQGGDVPPGGRRPERDRSHTAPAARRTARAHGPGDPESGALTRPEPADDDGPAR